MDSGHRRACGQELPSGA